MLADATKISSYHLKEGYDASQERVQNNRRVHRLFSTKRTSCSTQVRQAIKDAAPEAQEVISYSMPAFKQKSILVWFAAFKNHIGFFPKVSAMEAFKEQLVGYQTSKGTLRFPLDKPIPISLVKEIVKFRVKEGQSEE